MVMVTFYNKDGRFTRIYSSKGRAEAALRRMGYRKVWENKGFILNPTLCDWDGPNGEIASVSHEY